MIQLAVGNHWRRVTATEFALPDLRQPFARPCRPDIFLGGDVITRRPEELRPIGPFATRRNRLDIGRFRATEEDTRTQKENDSHGITRNGERKRNRAANRLFAARYDIVGEGKDGGALSRTLQHLWLHLPA